MAEVTEQVLTGIVDAIVREVGPEQIVLFGSLARGEGTNDSDIDLMVVERDAFGPERSRRREAARIREALRGVRAPFDILVFSRHEVEEWRSSLNHVIARALREGRVLYERH